MDGRRQLLAEVRDTLERVGCQFWACQGPTLEPVDMVTCFRCVTLAKVRAALGERPDDPGPGYVNFDDEPGPQLEPPSETRAI